MGQVIKVPGISTNTSLPKYYPHKIMSKGSLLLVEPAHPNCQFALTDNAVIPNIAKKTAMAMGAGTEAQVSGIFKSGTNGGISNGKYLFEKTSAGALHCIASQDKTKFTSDNDGGGMTFNDGILSYIKGNPTHNFFIGIKGRVTRAGNEIDTAQTTQVYPTMFIVAGTGYTANRFAYFSSKLSVAASTVNKPNPPSSFAPNSPTQFDFTRYAYTRGVYVGTLSSIIKCEVGFARTAVGANNYPAMYPAYPSWILHNLYIEDLTVSGRTETEVAAIYDAWHAESIATGGVYAGETYTSPTLIP